LPPQMTIILRDSPQDNRRDEDKRDEDAGCDPDPLELRPHILITSGDARRRDLRLSPPGNCGRLRGLRLRGRRRTAPPLPPAELGVPRRRAPRSPLRSPLHLPLLGYNFPARSAISPALRLG